MPLLGIIRSYVQSMGLATGEEVKPVAQEVLQEAVVEALNHVDRFDPTRQLMAWLLGIALNVIKRKKVQAAKHQRRELFLSQLSLLHPDSTNETDLLDEMLPSNMAGPEQEIEDKERAQALLSLVSADDQEILRLAFLEDYERDALARQLGLAPGTARVRLHRALNRLRSAWIAQQTKVQRGDEHA